MTTMQCQAFHLESPLPLTSIRTQCNVAYEPLPNSPSYGVELVFGGKVYQLFSNYANAPSNTVLLNGKGHLCHEPLKSFFYEFRKYVLGPRFGLVADKHQMILGLEGLDDPLISEMEAENDDCTLWEFWEQAPDPTLSFQMHVTTDITIEDEDGLSDDHIQPFFDEHQEESDSHVSNTDAKKIAICSPMSMSSSSPSTSSPPSSPHDSNFSASASEDSAKSATSSYYILDMGDKIVLDWDKQTVMDLEKRVVFDLDKGTILDLDKKTVLYLDKMSVLDLDSLTLRNMTQRIGCGTTEWNSVFTTEWINMDSALWTGQNSGNDIIGNEGVEDIQDSNEDPTSAPSDDQDSDEDLTSETSSEWWPKRNTDDGYDADVSNLSSECDGPGRLFKKARWNY
ncbi:hypothetical protein BG000_000488 [Podila horticola]|nr:hypothetical protein BG000_000488 [Podila horticola]